MPKKILSVTPRDIAESECLKVLLEHSNYYVQEEIYVNLYSNIAVKSIQTLERKVSPCESFMMERNISDTAADILRASGITNLYKGFRYLVEICNLIEREELYDCMVTKEIYPKLAKMYCTTPRSIEHGIRHAIRHGWDSRSFLNDSDSIWNEFQSRPSNKQFINSLFTIVKSKINPI